MGSLDGDKFVPIVIALFIVSGAALLWNFASVHQQPDCAPSSKTSLSIKQSKLRNNITTTIRISRVPKAITKEALMLWLQDLALSGASENVIQPSTKPCTHREFNFDISIASVNSEYSQAIITTSEDDGLRRIFMAESIRGPGGYEFDIDSHFRGMTVLHSQETHATDEIAADIIVVHGLGGHAIKSWESRTNSKLWLVDFLPEDVRNVRIMTYGYDTKLHIRDGEEHHGKKSINSIAKSMLEEICTVRSDDATLNRPIMIMGHSIGGLIIKEALIIASKSQGYKPWLRFFESCKSLVFFGVPNLGMSFDELARMVEGKESEQLVRDILVDADHDPRPLLQQLNESFVERIQGHQDLDMLCYYETRLSPPINKEIADGHSRGTLIVNQTSAAYTGLIVKSYNLLELEGDHRSMIKFPNRACHGYRSISERCREFVARVIETKHREQEALLRTRSELSLQDKSCLSSLAYSEMNHRRNEANEAHPYTCTWILEHEDYKSWKSRDRGLLWVKGKPGSGKSTLMAFLHEHLCQTSANEHLRLDFFFHRRGVELQKTMTGMLRSLLYQLYTKVPSIRTKLLQVFREKQILGEAGKTWQWHLKELQVLFSDAVLSTATSEMIIFVDALDEAGDEGARELAAYFHNLNDKISHINGTTKICISCRHFPIVATIPGLEIWVENYNGKDISTYVRDTLSSNLQVNTDQCISAETREIKTKIVENAQGVFQWARLVLPIVAERFNDGESLEEIREMLDRVPQGLSEVYEHILRIVIKPHHRSKSLLLMQWICLAERPLSLTELRFAMAADKTYTHPEQKSVKDVAGFIESDARMKKLAISLSGGLAEIKHHEDTNAVQFIHQSVHDFLLSRGLTVLLSMLHDKSPLNYSMNLDTSFPDDLFGKSQDRLTRSCANYLRSGEVIHKVKVLEENLKENLPFVDYAIRFCFVHAEKAESRGISQECLTEEFNPHHGHAFEGWIKAYSILDADGLSLKRPDFGSTLLHVASNSNLYSVAQNLLDKGAYVDEKDMSGNTPLQLAARYGSVKLVKLFLNFNADVRAQNFNRNTSLGLAAVNGHEEIVKELLNSGSDINMSTGDSGNALQAAATTGSTILVSMLLNSGADINAQSGTFGNALQAAICRRHESMVQLLLDSGAEVNVQGGYYGNALQAAPTKGVESIVHLLLHSGAEINAQGGKFGNALQAAAGTKGSEYIVHLLLHLGAEVNAQGGLYGNALQAAAATYQGHKSVVQLLLHLGAEVNAQGGYYGNALQAAASRGNEAIMQLLLNSGTEVNAQGGYYGNALQAAVVSGNEAVTQLILNSGAEVNAQGGDFDNALQAAAATGNKAVMQLLLNSGAEVNAQGGYYGNALQAAVSFENEAVIQLLLKSGAEVNAQGGYYGNALQAAASSENEAIIQLLLKSGAEVNAQGGYYGNALQAAASSGKEAVVQLLLNLGAEINAQGGKYGNALQAAAGYGNEAVVKLLLKSGAEINVQGGEFGNALQAAVVSGNEAVTQLILNSGAEVNVQGGDFGNALQAAAATGKEAVVQLLLNLGAEVNVQGGIYGNALQAAAYKGHEAVVQLLLNSGAEINVQGGIFNNALQAAAAFGKEAIVQTFLNLGAKVNAQGGHYGSALQAAASEGHKATVNLLLNSGAEINAQGGEYGNALQAATLNGYTDVAKLLEASAKEGK